MNKIETETWLDYYTYLIRFESKKKDDMIVTTEAEYWLDEDKVVINDIYCTKDNDYLGEETSRLSDKDKKEIVKYIKEKALQTVDPDLKRYKVIGIDWDCDDSRCKKDLPTDTYVCCHNEDEVVDFLTDVYGYCINSLKDIKKVNYGQN